ncbi:uncharacterized protein UV8b_00763 [Ustilaginoidea virens]|uniref:Uncharacterized protein n=1 Tax=Ustilaginoidea virens TaxID=1159556 RepID=A0A063BXV2_USTVR|nr:uncharacterized protein UV8b_00763 [Ustilaginoidea virens]QUC16522.1 hypothetical protein UV8b_00763 [Ustilaginoidea virens]GAO16672.1 hypothetical protein UVI_02012920 [Ustilaginoidea virens]
MDPDADDGAAVMQAMGFSSFGAQDRPQKKRRCSSAEDDDNNNNNNNNNTRFSQPGRARDAPTGSNSVPAGKPQAGESNAKPSTNTLEIDLGGDDDENERCQEARPPLAQACGETLAQKVGNHAAGLPARPIPLTGSAASTSHPPHKRPHGLWYEGYYDTTSNENPWEHLEKAMGLETGVSWVARKSQTPAAT